MAKTQSTAQWLAELSAFLREHEQTITNALENQARRMNESADSSEAAFKRGQADPNVMTTQDASLITNNGYRQLADRARGSAERAETAAAGLRELLERLADRE